MDLEETEDAHSGFGGRWTKIDDDCMVERMGRSSRRMEVRCYRLEMEMPYGSSRVPSTTDAWQAASSKCKYRRHWTMSALS